MSARETCSKCQNIFERNAMCWDHIIPLFVAQYTHLEFDVNNENNIQILCSNCHSVKSRNESSYFSYGLWKPVYMNKCIICLSCFQQVSEMHTCFGIPYKLNKKHEKKYASSNSNAQEFENIFNIQKNKTM